MKKTVSLFYMILALTSHRTIESGQAMSTYFLAKKFDPKKRVKFDALFEKIVTLQKNNRSFDKKELEQHIRNKIKELKEMRSYSDPNELGFTESEFESKESLLMLIALHLQLEVLSLQFTPKL